MAGLAQGLAKALERAVVPIVERAAGKTSKVVPELAERVGTKEQPAILKRALELAPKEGELPRGVREEGVAVPFAGPEDIRQASRTTAAPRRESLADIVDDTKVAVSGLWQPEPGLPKDLSNEMSALRSLEKRIGKQVELELRDDVLAPIRSLNPDEKLARKETFASMRKISDFMVNADRLAQATAEKADQIDGIPVSKLEEAVASAWNAMTPAMRQAHDNIRQKYDEAFEVAVERFGLDPERRREAYSPIKKMAMVVNSILRERGAAQADSQELAQLLRRAHGGAGGERETNAAVLLSDYLTAVRRRAAQDDLLASWVNDKTINFTDRPEIVSLLEQGKPLPPGLAFYTPKPGRMGYVNKDPLASAADGILDGMNIPETRDRGRALVFPERVVKALEGYNPRVAGDTENAIYKLGSAYSRAFTVYNPAVTSVNFISDHVLALSRELSEGGVGRAMGFLREWPDGVRSAYGGVFLGKDGAKFRRALNEGLTESTFTSEAGGLPVSEIMKEFREEPTRNLVEMAQAAVAWLPQQVAKGRQFVELLPKIAAGEEALRRTGDLKAYGKIGREITLDFSKAPALTRNPTARFMAPVYSFFGAATPYVIEQMKRNKGLNPMLAAAVAVPVTTMLWNYHDEEFAKVERSLPEYEQMNLHFIVPGLDGKPLKDQTGRYVVKRLQYWVPEEVAKLFGLGNLPSRLRQVADKRVTPGEFAAQSGSAAAKAWVGHVLPARLAYEMLVGRDWYTGQEKKRSESMAEIVPQTKMASDAYLGTKSYGLKEQLLRTASNLVGLTQAGMEQRGGAALDAALMDAKRDMATARARMVSLIRRGDTARAEDARKDMISARDRLKRVAEAIRAEGRKVKVSPADLKGGAYDTDEEEEQE